MGGFARQSSLPFLAWEGLIEKTLSILASYMYPSAVAQGLLFSGGEDRKAFDPGS